MERRRKNNIIIGTLCAVLVLMGVGYAILSTTLNIGATANITGDFDIHFTNIQRSSSTISDSSILSTIDAGTGITANTSSRAGTFTAVLQKPTDYVIYTVSVANTGSIDGYLTFSFEDTNSNFNYYKDFYSVEFIRDDVDPDISTDILQPNASFTDNEVLVKTSGTRTYKIKVTYKESATSFPDPTHEINNQAVGNFACELSLTYSQQAPSNNQQVAYVDQDDSCFISFRSGEINYYDSSKTGCNTTNIVIPDNLRLKTSTITGLSFNSQICAGYAQYLNSTNMSNEQFCNYIANQVAGMEYADVYGTVYAGMVTPTYDSPSGEYNVITKIGSSAFANKTLTGLSLSNNITQIGDAAFISTSLSQVTLPNSLTSIGEYAFMFDNLTSLTIPSSLQTIGKAGFSRNSISSLNLSNASSLTSIGPNAFFYNSLGTLDLSGATSLTSIGNEVFSKAGITGTLIIPSRITSIGRGAFDNNSITSLNLSGASSLTMIDEDSFYRNNLTSLTIPSSVQTIGHMAFSNNNITTIDLSNATGLVSLSIYVFTNEKDISDNSIDVLASIDASNKTKAQYDTISNNTPWYYSGNANFYITYSDYTCDVNNTCVAN